MSENRLTREVATREQAQRKKLGHPRNCCPLQTRSRAMDFGTFGRLCWVK